MFILQLKKELFFDFLRGYIDGDGCYYSKNGHSYMHITCGSEIVLRYIKGVLNDFNICVNIYKEREHKYRLMCTNIMEMSKLISLLYYDENVFCLTRKKEKIKSYLGSAMQKYIGNKGEKSVNA